MLLSAGCFLHDLVAEQPPSRVFEGSETPKGTTFPSIGADPDNASNLSAGGRSSGGGWSSFKDNSSAIARSKGRDDGGDDWTLTMKLLKEGSSAGCVEVEAAATHIRAITLWDAVVGFATALELPAFQARPGPRIR